MRAFEGNRDGDIDLQFITISEDKTTVEVSPWRVNYSCSNDAGQRESKQVSSNRWVTLSKSLDVGVDINGVAHCSPGMRPYAVSVTLSIYP